MWPILNHHSHGGGHLENKNMFNQSQASFKYVQPITDQFPDEATTTSQNGCQVYNVLEFGTNRYQCNDNVMIPNGFVIYFYT